MDTTPRKSLHPLITVAAIAVIVFSAVGIGAITGLIPTSKGNSATSPVADQDSPTVPHTTAAPEPRSSKPASAQAPARSAPQHPPYRAPERAAKAPEPAQAAPAPRAPVQVAAAEPSAPQAAPVCLDCGVIESVREIKQAGEGSGVGAVAGGVAGAVVGHQVGGGRGRDLATVLGAVGGAVAGHQVEKRVKSNTVYQVDVRMDDGNIRTFTEQSQPSWRAGDKVRVQGDRLISQG